MFKNKRARKEAIKATIKFYFNIKRLTVWLLWAAIIKAVVGCYILKSTICFVVVLALLIMLASGVFIMSYNQYKNEQ